jgi:hypothetical protein
LGAASAEATAHARTAALPQLRKGEDNKLRTRFMLIGFAAGRPVLLPARFIGLASLARDNQSSGAALATQ